MKNAIILIDIQNDYFEGGKNKLHLPEQAAAHAKQALEFFRSRNMPVFHVKHISIRQGATFFLSDSQGAEIHQSVTPKNGEKVIIKHFPDAFLQTGLADELLQQNMNHLVICGMMSHLCIDTTVRAAQNFGFSVTLLEDACTTKDLVWHDTEIPAETVHNTIMASLNGVFAQVLPTNQYIENMENLFSSNVG